MTDIKLQRLIIFEGPDCAGKSTVMNELLKTLSGDYERVHHGPFKGVSADQLPRFYVESMFNLFAGRSGLGMDRCWLSEPIYGRVFRGGTSRITPLERRQLERMALRHGAVVVLCLPPWEAVKSEWLKRKGADSEAEYLADVDQLRQVYDAYDELEAATDLPVVRYDYTKHHRHLQELASRVTLASTGLHGPAYLRSAGSARPKVVLVGERASDPTSRDTKWQFPFCSFGAGSSLWLTEQLEAGAISERDLYWVNADHGLFHLKDMWQVPIIALGQVAADRVLKDVGRAADAVVPHPQFQKRFKPSEQYPLCDIIFQHLT